MASSSTRHVVVLAPMPLEMHAITRAFGLAPSSDSEGAPWHGRVGRSDVTAFHIGMGPPATRDALRRLFDHGDPVDAPVDHVMIAGICGGVDPDVPVGTLLNPEVLIEHATGRTWEHHPPGDSPQSGKLMTTEGATMNLERSRAFFEQGCVGVDMESSAVAEMCEERGCEWSVYRCIGDRIFDGLLDERVVALTNPDGSGRMDEFAQLIAREPEMAGKLERLGRDATRAARRAAESAVRGCHALDA